jgi:hypothetical protein
MCASEKAREAERLSVSDQTGKTDELDASGGLSEIDYRRAGDGADEAVLDWVSESNTETDL